MKPRLQVILFSLLLTLNTHVNAQIDQGQAGAWYMYMWSQENTDTGFGLQGDIQHRNWDKGGDLEQLLVRGGLTWRPEASAFKYTLGKLSLYNELFLTLNRDIGDGRRVDYFDRNRA